ncbi:hypothetical protein [Streptomyces sp. WM4235]|uniref:hypothetical protein n=1 Tax=Streptomyces sp. WM4235 TaxID=1415551 RepID=UPI00131AD2D2|nr:hypothetical protein [Streptomyces sp. WM4235]
MSDLPDPQSVLEDLGKLVPELVPNPGADPDLVVIGERYWALAGFSPELGTPVWCEKVKDIDTAGWGHQIYAVAAAGVRAVVPGRTCSQCGEALSLTSRTAFQQVCDGQDSACVECTESLLSAVRVVLDPARKAKREAGRARTRQQEVLHDTGAAWAEVQKEVVAQRYATVFPRERTEPLSVSVKDMVATLALLRYASSTSPIADIGAWLDPLYPDMGEVTELLGSLVRAELLKIHPTSPAEAFVWDPASFEHALRDAGGDLDALAAPELNGSFHPLRARYYAPFGTSQGMAAEQLDIDLAAALGPALMSATQQAELLALARELIAEEALRYFTNRLEELNLPPVPENHGARLGDAAYKVAEHRPLGEIYNLVWRATRAAAEAAQKNPRAPRAHMSTYAVNRFEGDAQRAVAETEWELKPFSAIAGNGPAAMTRALFYSVLDLNPIDTSIPQLREGLPPPVAASIAAAGVTAPGHDDLAAVVAWLHAHPDAWDPRRVPAELGLLEQAREGAPDWHFEGKIIARDAARLHRLHLRLAPALGVKEAALAVLAATGMLVHPVTRDGVTVTSGEWILDALSVLFVDGSDGQV